MEIDPKNLGLVEETAQHYSSEENSEKSDSDSSSHSDSTSDEDETSAPNNRYYLRKWRRLKKHYNDQYLELFNDHCNHNPSSEDIQNLRDSQFGAVIWTSDEKKELFVAVAKFGRHNLTQLTNVVATKSAIEISAYLRSVHQAQIDRQLFRTHPKNISIVDIPAACEIGPECEAYLENAADALNAYQEQYDLAAGQTEGKLPWLIDHVVAAQLDTENDNISISSIDEPEEAPQNLAEQQSLMCQKLFYLSKMLELSELFFMNHPLDSSHSHWRSIAEPKQRPAMTNDCLHTLYDLVVERLRQIVKVSIQIADARLSFMATKRYSPSRKLGQSDVVTALEILDMPHDAWNFWAQMPRRNGQQVITGSHSKGEIRGRPMSYESAEAVLFPRRNRGRRRSVSVGSETSSVGSNLDKVSGLPLGLDIESTVEDVEPTAESVEGSVFEADDANDDLDEQSELGNLSDTDSEALDTAGDKTAIKRKRRRLLLEEELEQYAEKLDQAARSTEENKLWQVLGKRPNEDVEEEEEHKLGPRPKSLRRTQEELGSWSCKYMSEWEYYGDLLPNGNNGRNHESEAEVKTDGENTDRSN